MFYHFVELVLRRLSPFLFHRVTGEDGGPSFIPHYKSGYLLNAAILAGIEITTGDRRKPVAFKKPGEENVNYLKKPSGNEQKMKEIHLRRKLKTPVVLDRCLLIAQRGIHLLLKFSNWEFFIFSVKNSSSFFNFRPI